MTASGCRLATRLVAVVGYAFRKLAGMETNQVVRGRLLDHLQLVVKDIEASRKFYFALFETLGVPIGGQEKDHFWVDELFVSAIDSPASAGELTGRAHFAFQAKDRAQVDQAHTAALAAGGKEHGKPGERAKYHPGYYAGFLLDPDGNNVEVVFHGEHKRSADAVTITF